MAKKWYKSKTLWVGFITFVYGILNFFGVVASPLTPEAITIALSVIMIILRLITGEPVELKESGQ